MCELYNHKKNKERRKSQRFTTPLEVEYRTLNQNPIFGSVYSSDISKGGLAFTSHEMIREGTHVELRMNVPGDNVPVFATGTVSWSKGHKTGIKLVRMKHSDQEKVFEYIYREWRKSHRGLKHAKEFEAMAPQDPGPGHCPSTRKT